MTVSWEADMKPSGQKHFVIFIQLQYLKKKKQQL